MSPTELPSRQQPPWHRVAVTPSPHVLAGVGPVDVAVVGAGIVGMTTAALLAAGGASAVVLEDRHVGAGTTGFTTAKVTALHGARYQALVRDHGTEVAARYATANSDALDWIRTRCRRPDGGVAAFEDVAAVTYAGRAGDRRTVESEVEAATTAGLGVEFVEDVGLPVETFGGARLAAQGQFDAGGFLQLLADDAAVAGARIVEGVRVTGVDRVNGRIRLTTSVGPVEADWVVLATNLPFPDRSLLFARVAPQTSYAVTVEGGETLPVDAYLSAGPPTRSVRSVAHPSASGGRLLLVGGAGHPTGHLGFSTEDRYRQLVAFSRSFAGAGAAVHRWSAEDYSSPDGLPYVGPAGLLPETVLTATGFGKWGMTNGVAAGRILAARIAGTQLPPWAKDWNPARSELRALPAIARLNLGIAGHLAGGWLGGVVRRAPEPPPEGRGTTTIGRHGPVASATVDGRTRSVAGACTHLGAIVAWNDGDACWDCPLHGSRFGHDGTMLHGPATRDLAPRDR